MYSNQGGTFLYDNSLMSLPNYRSILDPERKVQRCHESSRASSAYAVGLPRGRADGEKAKTVLHVV